LGATAETAGLTHVDISADTSGSDANVVSAAAYTSTGVTILGSAGSNTDTLTGGAGADTITSGGDTAADTLSGGAGNDNFRYAADSSLFNGSAALIDSITGGAGTADAIVVANNAAATFTIALADSFAANISGVEKITAEASNNIITITLNNNAFEYGINTVDLSGDTTATAANFISVAA
jgi:hypothetical protein